MALALCEAKLNEGFIPINKNLWYDSLQIFTLIIISLTTVFFALFYL